MGKVKLLVTAIALYNGGAEKSLVNFLNLIDYSKYEVDLLLFRKEGLFLKQVPQTVNIVEADSSLKYCYNSPDKYILRSFTGLRSSLIRIIGSVCGKVFGKTLYIGKQIRWKYFFSKVIKKVPGKYDVAMAYMHGDNMWHLIDKVNADRKILWFHNDYSAYGTNVDWDLKYFEKADAVVSISETCVDILKKYFPSIKDKFCVLPNLSSSQFIYKLANEHEATELNGENIILSIGRLSNQKGFDYAVEAASILKKKNYRFKWYVIGDGELKERLIKEIKALGIIDSFFLLGAKINPYPYIKKCDIFVQTSRFEGKSIVLDEAKIMNKPIVVTNYQTVRDQIQNGYNGIIVPISADGIADGISKLIDNGIEREKLVRNLKKMDQGNAAEIAKYYSLMEN